MCAQVAEVEGFDGFYKVSSDGKVISPNGFKKPYITKTGYWRVTLWKNGKSTNHFIHRLVASAFIPNPNNFEMVNHIDGNKLNCDVSNLEWCDASHNMKHAYANNLVHSKTTKVIQYTKDFQKVREWESIQEACDVLHLNHANVVTVCGQKTNRKQCGGFIWRYANDI